MSEVSIKLKQETGSLDMNVATNTAKLTQAPFVIARQKVIEIIHSDQVKGGCRFGEFRGY